MLSILAEKTPTPSQTTDNEDKKAIKLGIALVTRSTDGQSNDLYFTDSEHVLDEQIKELFDLEFRVDTVNQHTLDVVKNGFEMVLFAKSHKNLKLKEFYVVNLSPKASLRADQDQEVTATDLEIKLEKKTLTNLDCESGILDI